MFMRDLTVADAERLSLEALAGERECVFQMEEDAFRAFYDRTSRAVWSYLSRVTGDRQLADDLLQETYYRFLRADAPYESEAHRRNSLFRIATNLARDAYRRHKARPPHDTHDDHLVPAPGPDPAGQFEKRTDLARAMEQLKPRERAMLWLAYAEGSSHQEIATAVGVKTGSVKLLLFRARRRLAGLLGRRTS